ncbi:MAG: TIM barrel protein, partial [Desulfurococcaceae archaeon]
TKICFDVGHAHVNGYNLLEFYKYIRNYLGVVHLHDNDGTKDQHLPPYSGSVDWASLLKYFNKNNLYVLEVYGTSIKAANMLKWLAHFVKINGMT